MNNFVTYRRVSTKKQKDTELGLDSQKEILASYIKHTGGQIVYDFEEVESGSHDDRPLLKAAIAKAKELGATLLVAKLDRLARSMSLIHMLMESKIDFRCADMPEMNSLTIYIFAAIAQHELNCIRDRTQKAMKILKARGAKLGTRNPKIAAALIGKAGQYDRVKHQQMRVQKLSEKYAPLIPMVRALIERDVPWTEIAKELNRGGGGGEWTRRKASRLFRQLIPA